MEISLQGRVAQSEVNFMISKELHHDEHREGQQLKGNSFMLIPEAVGCGLCYVQTNLV